MGVQQKYPSFYKAFLLTANSTEVFAFEELQQHDLLTLLHMLLMTQHQDSDIYFEKKSGLSRSLEDCFNFLIWQSLTTLMHIETDEVEDRTAVPDAEHWCSLRTQKTTQKA